MQVRGERQRCRRRRATPGCARPQGRSSSSGEENNAPVGVSVGTAAAMHRSIRTVRGGNNNSNNSSNISSDSSNNNTSSSNEDDDVVGLRPRCCDVRHDVLLTRVGDDDVCPECAATQARLMKVAARKLERRAAELDGGLLRGRSGSRRNRQEAKKNSKRKGGTHDDDRCRSKSRGASRRRDEGDKQPKAQGRRRRRRQEGGRSRSSRRRTAPIDHGDRRDETTALRVVEEPNELRGEAAKSTLFSSAIWSNENNSFALGQIARPHEMDLPSDDKEALIKIVKLREGDGAWVKRSPAPPPKDDGHDAHRTATPKWTYAVLSNIERGRRASLTFEVNDAGSYKRLPVSLWTSYIRVLSESAVLAEHHAMKSGGTGGGLGRSTSLSCHRRRRSVDDRGEERRRGRSSITTSRSNRDRLDEMMRRTRKSVRFGDDDENDTLRRSVRTTHQDDYYDDDDDEDNEQEEEEGAEAIMDVSLPSPPGGRNVELLNENEASMFTLDGRTSTSNTKLVKDFAISMYTLGGLDAFDDEDEDDEENLKYAPLGPDEDDDDNDEEDGGTVDDSYRSSRRSANRARLVQKLRERSSSNNERGRRMCDNGDKPNPQQGDDNGRGGSGKHRQPGSMLEKTKRMLKIKQMLTRSSSLPVDVAGKPKPYHSPPVISPRKKTTIRGILKRSKTTPGRYFDVVDSRVPDPPTSSRGGGGGTTEATDKILRFSTSSTASLSYDPSDEKSSHNTTTTGRYNFDVVDSRASSTPTSGGGGVGTEAATNKALRFSTTSSTGSSLGHDLSEKSFHFASALVAMRREDPEGRQHATPPSRSSSRERAWI